MKMNFNHILLTIMKTIKTYFLVLILSFSFSNTVNAQKVSKKDKQLITRFDKLLSEKFKTNEPGCAAIVSRKGQIIYKKAFGMANLELNVKAKPEMVFRIGSITKQFTSVAILQLLEQNKLSLQDEITKYIKDYPTHGYKITLEHLLTHTSGIKSYTGMTEWTETVRHKDFTPTELIDFFKNQPMDFAPGTKYKYNNSAYFLLGYIIEKVSGITYQKYLENNIFKPVGMNNTYYDSHSMIIKNRASGYQKSENTFENASYLSMTQPYSAGSIISTVNDLLNWNKAVHSYKLVKKETLEKAFTSYKLTNGQKTNYGYGWSLGDLQGSSTISHGGGINGFLSFGIYLPTEEVFVAIFSNCICNSPQDVAIKMAAYASDKSIDYKEITINVLELKKYVGVYENDEKEQRILTVENDTLYSLRTGGNKYRLIPFGENKFFFENTLTTLEIIKDEKGKLTKVISKGILSPAEIWIKTDKPIPSHTEIQLDEKTLGKYVGKYELTSNFMITITQKENKLFAQATGQSKIEIFAETKTKFFYKVVDAQIEFFMDDAGIVSKLVLHQNGEHEAKKIE